MRLVGRALDWHLLDAGALGGAIAAFKGVGRVAVQLDKPGIVHSGSKRVLDGFKVGPVPI